MGVTSTLVKRYVERLKPGQIFTTRDCLDFGRRAAVDQVLSRLVKGQILVRLTRGVFVGNCGDLPKPSLQEVARAKAFAFGRRITVDGNMLTNLQAQDNNNVVFLTDSGSSKFKYGDITVHLKQASWRRRSRVNETLASTVSGL